MNHNYYSLYTSAKRLPRDQFIYEEACIYANGNVITSFAKELNPTAVGEYIYIYIYIYELKKLEEKISKILLLDAIIFTNPSARAGYDTRSIFKRSLTGLNSEFSFSQTSCLTKAEEPSLPYYLPIAGGRIIGFISFPRVLVLCEMQSVSSRI